MPTALIGQRILLRPYQVDDAAALLAAIDESRDFLRPWVGWVDRYQTMTQVQDYCLERAAQWVAHTDFSAGMFLREERTLLGGAGLHYPTRDRHLLEVSCWLRASAPSRGYGTEALDLLADLAFTHLDARLIRLHSDVRNGPTQRLAAKCGYTYRGTVRDGYAAPDGERVDLLVYALTPDLWRQGADPHGISPAVEE
jgi:RimJ/RimL family protein N-acetyltransferase